VTTVVVSVVDVTSVFPLVVLTRAVVVGVVVVASFPVNIPVVTPSTPELKVVTGVVVVGRVADVCPVVTSLVARRDVLIGLLVIVVDAIGVAPVVASIVVTRVVLTVSIAVASSLVVIFIVNTGLMSRKIVGDVVAAGDVSSVLKPIVVM